jgi:type III restriction enzyme
MFPMVKDSLGNALADHPSPLSCSTRGTAPSPTSPSARSTASIPCFVLELTATPQDVQPRGGKQPPREGRYANVLVEVTGRELDREGMIRMPLNLDPRQSRRLEGSPQRRPRPS